MPSAARTTTMSTGGHRASPTTARSDRDEWNDGRVDRTSQAVRVDRRGARTADRAIRPRRPGSTAAPLLSTPRWLPAAALIGGPIVGALLGKALGGYHGPFFALLTIASAALATAATTPSGRWWVIPALPPIAWLVAAAAELAWHDPPYPDAKAKAVGLVHATTHVFPVIVAALAAMALVCLVPLCKRGAGRV